MHPAGFQDGTGAPWRAQGVVTGTSVGVPARRTSLRAGPLQKGASTVFQGLRDELKPGLDWWFPAVCHRADPRGVIVKVGSERLDARLGVVRIFACDLSFSEHVNEVASRLFRNVAFR